MTAKASPKDAALKLALEALEYCWSESYNTNGYKARELSNKAITAIKEALAKPEQEPVAWRNAAIRVGEDLCSVGPFGYYDMTAAQWLDWALSVVTVHAPPPQRTWEKPWVSLTDDDINLLEELYAPPVHPDFVNDADHCFSLIKHVEAKLKEKNT